MALVCINGNRECDGCGICFDQPVVCDMCEERITDHYYEINNIVLCQECMEDMYRKEID